MKTHILLMLAISLSLLVPIAAQNSLDLGHGTIKRASGFYLPVKAKPAAPVTVVGFDIQLQDGTWDIDVYSRDVTGMITGAMTNWNWTLIGSAASVVGNNSTELGDHIHLPIALSTPIAAGLTQTFYITVTNSIDGIMGLRYADTNPVIPSDAHIEAPEGTWCHNYPLGQPGTEGRRFSGKIHYTVGTPVANDVGLAWISSPHSSTAATCASTTQSNAPVIIGVRNTGSATIPAGTTLPVSYSADNGGGAPPIVGMGAITLTAPLAPLEVVQYAFPATVNLSWSPLWTFTATVSWPLDLSVANNARSRTVRNYTDTKSGPWTQDFDATVPPGFTVGVYFYTPPGWNNMQPNSGAVQPGATGAGFWLYRRGVTPSSSMTGPLLGDHTTGGGNGCYIAIEDGAVAGNWNPIEMYSPCTNLAGFTGTPTLQFWFCSSPSAQANILHVDVIDYGTGTAVRTNDVATYGAETDRSWYKKTVDLSAFSGSKVVICFRSRNDNGNQNSDVCIDDISMLDVVPSLGQPRQPGFAGLDINQAAMNSNGGNVASGANGPFAVNVQSGSMMDINIHGAPWHPWLLLSGPSNVNSGSGPFGQFDIGVSSGGSVPTGISILANGMDPGMAGYWQAVFTTGMGDHTTSWSLNVPVGTIIPLQAAVLTGQSSVIALSNSVVITVTN